MTKPIKMTLVMILLSALLLGTAQATPITSDTNISASTSQVTPVGVQFVDLLWIKPGVKPEAAIHYFRELLTPILEKHGGKVVFVYQVEQVMKGELKPAITASLTLPSMAALKLVFSDPDYAKIIPVRDATFDFTQQSLLKVKAM